ncbi:hypothetical protein D3C75_1156070 [compost metagenome]
MNAVFQPANRQAGVIGVVDTKMQHEFLFEQFGPHHFDLEQMHLGLKVVVGEPGDAAAEAQGHQQGECPQCAPLAEHGVAPFYTLEYSGPSVVTRKTPRNTS